MTTGRRNVIVMIDWLGMLTTAFLLGLLGSGHCVAMCGGIMGALSMRSSRIHGHNNAAMSLDLLHYNLGRLLSYTALGLVLGLLGAALVWAVAPLQIVMRTLAGVVLIIMGLYIADIWRGAMALERAGDGIWRRINGRLRKAGGGDHPLLLGLGWGLLPCGLVYGTLTWALATGDPLLSAQLMFTFGLGTLPMVLAGSYFAGRLTTLMRLPAWRRGSGALIILFGFWTLFGGLPHGQHG